MRAAMRPWPVAMGVLVSIPSAMRRGAWPFSDNAHRVPLAPVPSRPEGPPACSCRIGSSAGTARTAQGVGSGADVAFALTRPPACAQPGQACEQGVAPGRPKRAQLAHTAPMYSPRAG